MIGRGDSAAAARVTACLIIGSLLFSPEQGSAQPPPRTRNVVLIVADGLRWQEVFTGAELALLSKEHGGVEDTLAMRATYWRETSDQRRRVLMPFFWSTISRHGQLYGNRTKGSTARVTNGLKFSYPGYNEMLAGYPDPAIDRNDFGPNPNATVLEWLNALPEFRGRVAAFGTWDAFAAILNRERSHIFLRAGWELPEGGRLTPQRRLLADLYRTTTRLWDDVVYDAFMHAAVLDYVRENRPRVLFVGFGETDIWAHDGRYDRMLRSAHQTDQFIADLWDTMQRMPDYRDRTTFIITTDHGRGSGLGSWRDHGRDIEGAENIWIAVLGPDTPALGERVRVNAVTQGQIAATIAELLGKNYRIVAPAAAPSIVDAVAKARAAP